MNVVKPNSPEAMEICKKVGQQDRDEHSGKKLLNGKARISDEKRERIYIDKMMGMTCAEVAKKHGIATSTAQRIVKEEMDKRTTFIEAGKIDGYAVRAPKNLEKAPATVEEPTEAKIIIQPEYTTKAQTMPQRSRSDLMETALVLAQTLQDLIRIIGRKEN